MTPGDEARASGGVERRARIRGALAKAGLDAVVCTLPHDVLLVFVHGGRRLHVGLRETAVASRFRGPLSNLSRVRPVASRAGGFVFCMSGPNAEYAARSYQLSTTRRIKSGEPVLIHCNSFVDGYWTDITRTFCLGEPPPRVRAAFDAVLAARDAALATICAGSRAVDVDRAAREVFDRLGFGRYVRHSVGHGVGFAAIDHDAPPRLTPGSQDVLEEGMVMNVEPGLYGRDMGGVRHCDVVRVTRDGYDLFTPILCDSDELIKPIGRVAPVTSHRATLEH